VEDYQQRTFRVAERQSVRDQCDPGEAGIGSYHRPTPPGHSTGWAPHSRAPNGVPPASRWKIAPIGAH